MVGEFGEWVVSSAGLGAEANIEHLCSFIVGVDINTEAVCIVKSYDLYRKVPAYKPLHLQQEKKKACV